MRKDKFGILPEYPLSCFPQGGNDGFSDKLRIMEEIESLTEE